MRLVTRSVIAAREGANKTVWITDKAGFIPQLETVLPPILSRCNRYLAKKPGSSQVRLKVVEFGHL